MASWNFEYWWCDSQTYAKIIKSVFGNKKNYRRYTEEVKWKNWNNWLLSLGYRDDLY